MSILKNVFRNVKNLFKDNSNQSNFAPPGAKSFSPDEMYTQTQLVGADGLYTCDVELKEGKKRLLSDAIVTVEEIFGQDRFADCWLYMGTADDSYGVGGVGDTVRIQIAAKDDPVLWPAIDVTSTVTQLMLDDDYPEVELAKDIISDLNTDFNFKLHFKAALIKDTSHIHISARVRGEWGQRSTPQAFLVTTTGTTVVTAAQDKIVMQPKSTSLSRDPFDPRVGILGISGTVSVIPGAIGNLYIEHPRETLLNSPEFNVLGTLATPRVFSIPLVPGSDIFVKEIRFFGTASTIKFGQFLSINSPLTNGIKVEIKSDDDILQSDNIYTTEDFKHEWTFGGLFQLDDQPGLADFLATFVFDTPFPIRAPGTFAEESGIDDYIKVDIRDNLSSITRLRALVFGFTQEV